VTAVSHLEKAVQVNVRIDNRPAAAISRAQLAKGLVARGKQGDLGQARALLTRAIGEAHAMGMTKRVEEWVAQADSLTPSNTPAVLHWSSGAGWAVQSGNTHFPLPELVGLDYLARLLEYPDQDLAAVDLVGSAVLAGRQDLLDDTAIDAYRRRVRDLDSAIDDAEANADLTKAQRLKSERDAVADELVRAMGLGGRVRGFATSPERARTAVRKAIKRALDSISEHDPVLGGELSNTITTGTACRYTPGSRQWTVQR
jgi:hypothetical protein